MRLFSCAFALVLLSAASASALADDAFTLTDGTNTISFTLPSSPTPVNDAQFFSNDGFAVENVPGVINGSSVNLGEVRFWGPHAPSPAGIQIDNVGGNPQELYQGGAALFTGDVLNPTFVPGTYNLTNFAPLGEVFEGNFTLSIVPTPEPSTMLEVGTGLFGVAGLIRRRLLSFRR